MDTKKIRQKILDLAIHGRLVPQDPADEPASALLERIKAEKGRLVKEGKMKRGKETAKTSNAPRYEDIPKGWYVCTLGDLCVFENGFAFSSDKYKSTGIPLIRISNIVDNKIDLSSCVFIQEEVEEKFIVSKGDLLIAMSGATTGKMGVYSSTIKAYLNQRVGNLKIIDSQVLLPKFRDYYMQSKVEEVLQMAYGGAQPNISGPTICSFSFYLPPLAEQQRIVAEIERWFSLIGQIEQGKAGLQAAIKQAKGKILDLAIRGRLVPQDPADEPAIELLKRINPDFTPCDNGHSRKFPFEIPDIWIWCGHNSILDISGGAQPAKSYFETTPKPNYIRLYQIRDYGESPVPIYIPISLASKQTEKGDILLARYGGSLGKVFHAEQGAYNVAMAKVVFKFDNLIYKEFAYYYYLSDLYQNKLKEISRTAQAGFNSTDFNDMYFPLPPLAEQQRIVRKVEELFSALDDIQKALEA